jgi:hypothetical protein
LLVEGTDDLYVIVELMKQNGVAWPGGKDVDPPVSIKPIRGIDAVMRAPFLAGELKQPGLLTLGIMIDADDDPKGRWSWFQKQLAAHEFQDLPDVMPEGGIIAENPDGLRVGLWLMPDCGSTGMLETFLALLARGPDSAVWDHASASFETARLLGAPCRNAHHDKARIHTWLAWQDPPATSFGLALTKKILDPSAPGAKAFVAWFKALFRL